MWGPTFYGFFIVDGYNVGADSNDLSCAGRQKFSSMTLQRGPTYHISDAAGECPGAGHQSERDKQDKVRSPWPEKVLDSC